MFRDAAPSGRGAGGNFTRSSPQNPAIVSNAADSVPLSLAKGFVYIINNSKFPGGIQAALHLLDTYGNTKVISNPHLSALDNQKATIKAGDRIPICQQSTVGGTVNNVVTTTSQYIDTGVLLQVTPHINVGGLVMLDVQAEVSIPGTSGPGCDQPPPINTRSVQTNVAVQSGQTMVMGGLINEVKKNSSTGIPLFSRIPVLGGLFGDQTLNNNRTELIVFITPRVIDNEVDMQAVTENLRRRMEQLDKEFPFGKRESWATGASSNGPDAGPAPAPAPVPAPAPAPVVPPAPAPAVQTAPTSSFGPPPAGGQTPAQPAAAAPPTVRYPDYTYR
jgi:general secretion pathway protein D